MGHPPHGLPTAVETATALFHHMFRVYGLPEDIVSNRGIQFTSLVLLLSSKYQYHIRLPIHNLMTRQRVSVSKLVGTCTLTVSFCLWLADRHRTHPLIFIADPIPVHVGVSTAFPNSQRVWENAHVFLQRAISAGRPIPPPLLRLTTRPTYMAILKKKTVCNYPVKSLAHNTYGL